MDSGWGSPAGEKREAITLRALITGMAGFAGSHLTDFLLNQHHVEVYGIDFPTADTRNIAQVMSRIALCRADLNDYDAVVSALDSIRPDTVFHLAAQASVRRAWADPASTIVNNVTAQLNLLRALIELGLSPRVLIVGSADEYGLVQPQDLPVDEDTPLRPLNPYAVSKLTQDYLGYQYHLSHGLPIVRVRPFNHIGSRQGLGFVVPDFSEQIARIELGLQRPVLQVGNLSAQRDFSDVRDIVRGYYLALTRGTPGQVYNLGSSHAYSIGEILRMLLALSRSKISVEQDESRMRPSDTPVVVSDCRRITYDTGWEPQYDISTSLAHVLEYWRQRVRGSAPSADGETHQQREGKR